MKTITHSIFILILLAAYFALDIKTASAQSPPTADFEADLTLIPVGNSINFTNLTTGDAISWEWTFEGGTPSAFSGPVPPQVYYETAGDWDVRLIVTDEIGFFRDTLTKTDYIHVVDYPAGWDYVQTGTSHIISIPADVTFISSAMSPGDFIGAFYLDENGDEKCGGANVWDSINNIAVLAYGNDVTTPDIKEGFDVGEPFIWKVFFSGTSTEKNAFVTYDEALPNYDGLFYDNGLSSLTSIDTDPLTVSATASPEGICLGDEVQLNAEAVGGTGSYTFAWTSVPAGFTSDLQNPLDTPSQTTKYFVAVDDGNRIVVDSVLVEIISPQANAGQDQTSCEDTPVVLSGIATNYSAVSWSSDGDGFFTGADQLEATYTAGDNDISIGSVTLTLSAEPNDPCSVTATSSLLATIVSAATANAGQDQSTCEDNPVILSGSATNYSAVYWTSDGDGNFTGGDQLDASYTAGANDIASGSVMLTLNVEPNDPCTTTAISSLMVTIVSEATANAGEDLDVCYNVENTSFQLDATVTNASSVLWETAGDGEFDDPMTEDPVYTPGDADLDNGSVVLTLTAESMDPCSAVAVDQLTLAFVFEPEVFAGDNAEICPGETYELNEATATNFSEILWETGGDGEFNDTTALNPVYTPGSGDITAGSVDLCITAQPNNPCTLGAISCITLSIFDEQAIVIPAGWSGLSSYLDPTNPDVEILLAYIAADLMIMYNAVGEIYKPAFGENTIVEWDSYDGYYIKLENEVTLNICGEPLENKSLNLVAGWNVIPVLSDVDVAVGDVFDAVADKVIVIQEIAGTKLWYPAYGISTLEMLMTGKAYLVKVSEEVLISFDNNLIYWGFSNDDIVLEDEILTGYSFIDLTPSEIEINFAMTEPAYPWFAAPVTSIYTEYLDVLGGWNDIHGAYNVSEVVLNGTLYKLYVYKFITQIDAHKYRE